MIERNHGLDVVKGLAVLLMLHQHLTIWFWHVPGLPLVELVRHYPVLMLSNSLGGFAAPLFVMAAGFGSVLAFHKGTETGVIVRRGFCILIFGYVLNSVTPSWFSMGSWYILHLIGFALMLSPWLNKRSSGFLVVMLAVVAAVTPLGQFILATPDYLTNQYMADYSRTGGILRLMFFEGQFPLFPWLGIFIWGIVAGRFLIHGRGGLVLLLSIAVVVLGAGAGVVGYMTNHLFSGTFLSVFLKPSPVFYPARLPVMFLLAGSAGILIFLFVYRWSSAISSTNFLTSMGRASLTIFMVHIPLFRELSVRFDVHHTFTGGASLLLSLAIICSFAAGAHLWSRYEYKGGFEHLMRSCGRFAP